jgi:hypothetical protein
MFSMLYGPFYQWEDERRLCFESLRFRAAQSGPVNGLPLQVHEHASHETARSGAPHWTHKAMTDIAQER